MDLKNYRKCDKCRKLYDISPFANMLGNGELAYSGVEVYGDRYDLCPKCMHELYEFLKRE